MHVSKVRFVFIVVFITELYYDYYNKTTAIQPKAFGNEINIVIPSWLVVGVIFFFP